MIIKIEVINWRIYLAHFYIENMRSALCESVIKLTALTFKGSTRKYAGQWPEVKNAIKVLQWNGASTEMIITKFNWNFVNRYFIALVKVDNFFILFSSFALFCELFFRISVLQIDTKCGRYLKINIKLLVPVNIFNTYT